MNLSSVTHRSPRSVRLISVLVLAGLLCANVIPWPVLQAGRAEAAAPLLTFVDTRGHWAEPAITLLAAKSVVSGFPGGTFQPGDPLTRAQFAKLAVAGLQGSAVADMLQPFPGVFSDLDGHWARGWVAAALERGLVRGYGAGRFAPDEGINRAQVAAVLVRALGWEHEAQALAATSALELLAGHPDSDVVPDWALAYVALAAQRGLLRGYEDGTLRPQAAVTRAEAAALIARTLDRLSLLYDIGGRFAAITPGGDVVLDQVWGWPAGSPGAVSVKTVPSTQWLRNGQLTTPAGLVDGDRVLLVLGNPFTLNGVTAPALCVVALSWDLLGYVTSTAPELGEVTLQATEGSLKIRVGAGAAVFRHGVPSDLVGLAVDDRVYVQIDPLSGEAQYLDAVHVALSGVVHNSAPIGDLMALDVVDPAEQHSQQSDEAVLPQRVYLGPAALVLINGEPASPSGIAAGMRVELAVPLAAGDSYGYAEAWTEPGLAGAGATSYRAGGVSGDRFVFRPSLAATSSRWQKDGSPTAVQAALGDAQLSVAQVDTGDEVSGVGLSVAATGAPLLWTGQGADGVGVTVAVVDTGVDPSHEILRTTSNGQRKIVDWVDLTGEGRVDTLFAATSFGGYVATRLGPVRLGTYGSRSGIYRSGVVDEATLFGEHGQGVDLNGNGFDNDQFALVLVDVAVPGVYNLALLDTNGDRDLRGEVPLYCIRDDGGWTVFRTAEGEAGLGVVLSYADRLGTYAILGFDANGHGTHVAGVAVGHDSLGVLGVEGAGAPGMAPGAQLMVVKALGADGSGSWDQIRAGVEYAAMSGADVCVLAIEAPGSAVQDEYESIAEIAEDHGMLVFIAGGNSGPGLSTAASSPNDDVLVPVGGYVSREMWPRLLGYDVGRDTVWLYNSCGPAASGGVAPLLLAPAAAVSSVPRLVSDNGYRMYEGTSMAAPHAAGAAALLIDYGRAAGIDIEPRDIVRALAAGARQLTAVSYAEQGFGVLDTMRAAEQLVPHGTPGRVQFDSALSAGLWDRGYSDRTSVDWLLSLANTGQELLRVGLSSTSGSLAPGLEALVLPAGMARELRLQPGTNLVAGEDTLYDLIVARDLDTGELLGAIVAHLPREEQFAKGPFAALDLSGSVRPGQMSRQYVEVPDGSGQMTVTVALTNPQAGAIEGYLYSPTGHLVGETGPLGVGGLRASSAFAVANAPPGVWEVVIWGAPEASAVSSFQIVLATTGVRPAVKPERVRIQPGVTSATQAVTVEIDLPANTVDLFVEAYGWFAPSSEPVTDWYVDDVTGTASRIWMPPAVGRGTGILEVSLRGLAPGDADLFVYYLQGGAEGNWLDAGTSRLDGRTSERLLLWQPDSGQYAVVAEGQIGGQRYGVALAVTRWPAGTVILDQASAPLSQETRRSVTLDLPVPVGAPGVHRAEILIRDAETMLPLATLPFHLEVESGEVLPVVAPSLTSQGQLPGGDQGLPLLKVYGQDTLVPANASIIYGRRVSSAAGGLSRLGPNTLGYAPVAGQAVEVAIEAQGYCSWRGQIEMPEPSALPLVSSDAAGSCPFAWRADQVGLREALRAKSKVLRPFRF